MHTLSVLPEVAYPRLFDWQFDDLVKFIVLIYIFLIVKMAFISHVYWPFEFPLHFKQKRLTVDYSCIFLLICCTNQYIFFTYSDNSHLSLHIHITVIYINIFCHIWYVRKLMLRLFYNN